MAKTSEKYGAPVDAVQVTVEGAAELFAWIACHGGGKVTWLLTENVPVPDSIIWRIDDIGGGTQETRAFMGDYLLASLEVHTSSQFHARHRRLSKEEA